MQPITSLLDFLEESSSSQNYVKGSIYPKGWGSTVLPQA